MEPADADDSWFWPRIIAWRAEQLLALEGELMTRMGQMEGQVLKDEEEMKREVVVDEVNLQVDGPCPCNSHIEQMLYGTWSSS